VYLTFQVKGKKYRLKTEKAVEAISGILFGLMVIAVFCFFFGLCYRGFLR